MSNRHPHAPPQVTTPMAAVVLGAFQLLGHRVDGLHAASSGDRHQVRHADIAALVPDSPVLRLARVLDVNQFAVSRIDWYEPSVIAVNGWCGPAVVSGVSVPRRPRGAGAWQQ